MTLNPLTGLNVVTIAGSTAGAYCAKLFADAGANVTAVGTGMLRVHEQWYFHEHVRSASLDDLQDRDFADVDVLIESAATEALNPVTLSGDTPRMVRVQCSPFGSFGPKAGWKSSDRIDYATSGHAYLYGDPNRAPLPGPPGQPAIATGLYAFIGAMAALFVRNRTGRGQIVEVTHLETMAALHQITTLRWLTGNGLLCRTGNRYTGQGQPNGPFRCRDGWITIAGVTEPQIEGLLAVAGLTHLLERPEIADVLDVQNHPELVEPAIANWLADQPLHDTVELLQAMRIPAAPVLTPAEVLTDAQLADRQFFRPHAQHADVTVPKSPFTITTAADPSAPNGTARSPEQPDADAPPLAGLRVLDLTRIWAGPLCGRLLADLGAEVIAVDAPLQRGPRELPQSFVDATGYYAKPSGDRSNPGPADHEHWHLNTHQLKFALGKKSLAIDLQSTKGQKAFAQLVPTADVLIENFSTRVMPQLGFAEEKLHELNPTLIYVTMPGYGRSGPAENWIAYGSTVDSHAGLSTLIGYDANTPWKGGVAWPDPIAGLHAGAATLMALWHQQSTTPAGMTIECAQFESTVAAVGEHLVRAQTNSDPANDPVVDDMFPCQGDDQWIAITASRADLEALGDLASIDHTQLSDIDALHERLTTFTRGQSAQDLASALQAAGITAGAVATAPELLADTHLAARGYWHRIDLVGVGPFTFASTPLRLSDTPLPRRRPAATFGQHNAELLRGAGLLDTEIAELAAAGIIVNEPPIT